MLSQVDCSACHPFCSVMFCRLGWSSGRFTELNSKAVGSPKIWGLQTGTKHASRSKENKFNQLSLLVGCFMCRCDHGSGSPMTIQLLNGLKHVETTEVNGDWKSRIQLNGRLSIISYQCWTQRGHMNHMISYDGFQLQGLQVSNSWALP